MKSLRTQKQSAGFALLELVLYIGLLSVVLSALVMFTVDFFSLNAKTLALAEVSRNTKFAVSRIAYEVRAADDIDFDNSVFDTNPGTLALTTTNPALDPTVFSVIDGQLMMSQGGGAEVALTPASLEVRDFTVSNVADTTRSRSVQVKLALGVVSTGSLEELSSESYYETTARVWKNDGLNTGGTPEPQSALTQSAYRFYGNLDSTDVGAPLAALNTAASLTTDGDDFRLRALLHVSGAEVAAGAESFKLQYAIKSGTCDTSFSGESYIDVTAATPIAYNDNSPADGTALTGNANDPTHGGHTVVDQTYEELNNVTSTSVITDGADGLWDFALTDKDGDSSVSYCLRIVKADGSLLDAYTEIPEVTTTVHVPLPTFRLAEYYTSFTGTTYNLTLDQDLEPNYFVIIRGADGSDTSGNNTGPDENYVALTSDPFGTGDLAISGASDVIGLTRHNNAYGWRGVITVVECLGDCDTSGFKLLSVERIAHSGSNTSGQEQSATTWDDLSQIMLLGGFNGAGCDTTESSNNNYNACFAKIWPDSTADIKWTRNSSGGSLSTATSTVMVVEWGSEWTVQMVEISGSNGGNGANATGEYDTESIASVNRDDTWVWGTGHVDDNGIGDAAEGVLITLGNGVDENVTESTVAIGSEYRDFKDFVVYALAHDDLAVNYFFKTDGSNSSLTSDASVDSAPAGSRMSLVTNGCNGTGTAYPRPIFSARYISDTFIRMERRRSGQNFPAWIQGVNFSGITY